MLVHFLQFVIAYFTFYIPTIPIINDTKFIVKNLKKNKINIDFKTV